MITVIYLTTVWYTCGHWRKFGYGETIKKFCWCHAGIEKIEHKEEMSVT